MPRKATGSFVTYQAADGKPYYRGRIRLGDGSREWVDPDPKMSEARAREWVAFMQEKENRDGLLLARKRGELEKIAAVAETFETYAPRWIKAREGRGHSSADTELGYLTKHVFEILGKLPMTGIGPEQIEDVRDMLDAKVQGGVFKWKTAMNIWGIVTSLFRDACRSKVRTLRILKSDPTEGIEPPDEGEETAKNFLYPREFLQLVACEDVPLRFRRLFCLAVYLYARAGELHSLGFDRGIDTEQWVASITEQVDRRSAKRRATKGKNVRDVPIEPNLRPLLTLIREEVGEKGALTKLDPRNRKLANILRRCLALAGVNRPALYRRTPTTAPITFHDLRATGITWCAHRGDRPLVLKQRAGHKSLATTEGYIRTAENLKEAIGEVFPELPAAVLVRAKDRANFDKEQVRHPRNKAKRAVEAPGIEPDAIQPIVGNARENLETSDSEGTISARDKSANPGSFGPPLGQLDPFGPSGKRPIGRPRKVAPPEPPSQSAKAPPKAAGSRP